MREKDISLCVFFLVSVISLPGGFCSGWTPIAPPTNYYAAKPADCTSDCDASFKNPFLNDADQGRAAETQVKKTLLSPPVAFNQEKGFRQSNKKLDLEIFKPTEVSFFPSEDGKTYQEVFQQSPLSFVSFKTFGGPGKPTKTIYYGDLELAKPKFPTDVKYYKPYKQSLKSDFDNDVNFYQPTKGGFFNEHCSLYKVSFRQDLYYQYVQYKVHMPELKEFTLCLWARFHNHSHDHSLFSYGMKHQRQSIYMWVSNLNEPGLFNMKVLGQTIYRLNYPIKLYKWYHTCQSWNGNTGEWQVWVDSHRIARGFHNLLVNHPIPGGGIAISGQESRHFGRGFQEIPQYYKGTGGLQGEITMLQMYKIALTAGKAYNDHSHHHSHYTTTTTEPPEIPTEEPSTTTDHPLLENGQLKKHVNVLELAEALKKGQLDTHIHSDHPATYNHFFHKPLSHPYITHVASLPVHGSTINLVGLPSHAIFKRNDESEAEGIKIPAEEGDTGLARNESFGRIKFISNVSDHVQVEKIKFPNPEADLSKENLMILPQQQESLKTNITAEIPAELSSEERSEKQNKRGGKRLRRQSIIRVESNRTKRITFGDQRPSRFFLVKKRVDPNKSTPRKTTEWKEASKRFSVLEDPYLGFGQVGLTGYDVRLPYGGVQSTGFSNDYFPHFGQDYTDLHGGEQSTSNENFEDPLSNSDDSGKKVRQEVELAEGEVRRVMELCSGCHLDPFRKVAVISWRSTPKKMYSGTLFLKAKSECRNF